MRLHLLLGLLLLGSLMYCHADDSIDEDEIESEDDDGVVEIEEDSTPAKAQIMYQRPVPLEKTHFNEPFDTRAEYLKRWVLSQAKKDGAEAEVAKYDGKWSVEEPVEDNPIMNDLGLVLKSKAKHSAVSAKLDQLFSFTNKPLIAQYEVRFQNGMDCGGAYMKLLSQPDDGALNLKAFTDKTPYTIMFGPDKCGNDNKLHFIFRHRNPITGEYEEKHAEKPTAKLDSYFTDRKTHLYTLIVRPDNTYEIKIDNKVVSTGNLLKNMSPPVNPPKEIEDPNARKPADWDVREKIPNPDAVKPDDWDESEPATIVDIDAEKPDGWLEDEEVYIADPSAVKPEDWDEEMDGEWEAPRIDNPNCSGASGCGKWEPPAIANPKYMGKWKAPMIDNPNYKGEWKPQIIPNPNYFEDKAPFEMTAIAAVGLELWSMSNDILFDNIIISDKESVVDDFTSITWEVKNAQEKAASSGGMMQAIKDATNEKPWLWAVFILVVVLPVVLIVTYCCSGTSTKPEDIAAHKKKFDDITPDTIPEEGEDELKEEGQVDEKGAGGDGEGVRGDGLDIKQKGAAGDGEETDEEDDETEIITKDDDDETEIITKDDAAEEESPEKSSSPRRRRARKE